MQKALFLDRDGVINIEKNYLYKIEDFEFMYGIFELCQYYSDRDYLIIVVTNQSGIARGYYSKEQFQSLTSWMITQFESKDILIAKTYFCPHHPSISGECECRKPKPGMLLEAAKEFSIDLSSSILVGDKERDIEAGLNAGLTQTYLYDEFNSYTDSKASKIVNNLDEIWSKEC